MPSRSEASSTSARPSEGDTSPLPDRTVVISGASRGIGRALAERLAAEGARVVATHVGDGTPRPGDEGALAAEDVADAIVYSLTRPARMRLDEMHFHPHGQTPEF